MLKHIWGDNLKLKITILLGFLITFQIAMTAYINSSFLSTFAGEKTVGIVYLLASISSIFYLIRVPQWLNKLGGYKFLLWTSGLSALSLLALTVFARPLQVVPVFIFYFTLNGLIIFAIDELFQIFSQDSHVGRKRGMYLSIVNMAWVISQTISGRVLESFSFSTVYLFGFLIMSFFFLTVYLNFEDLKDPQYDDVLAKDSFKNFFQNIDLARAYKFNFLLQFFFASMVIYIPIYLHTHIGFDWAQIGTIFTIMLLPFVLIPYPLGKKSEKIGEKKMLILGFLIISLATISLFFVSAKVVWIWAGILFITRCGAAIIEVMSDVYFFKHITRENDEYVSIYRNTVPFSYIMAPVVAFIVFLVTPSYNYIFLILGAIMLYGVYLASTIKRSDI